MRKCCTLREYVTNVLHKYKVDFPYRTYSRVSGTVFGAVSSDSSAGCRRVWSPFTIVRANLHTIVHVNLHHTSVEKICAALHEKKSLTDLDISWNNLLPNTMYYIAETLGTNRFL